MVKESAGLLLYRHRIGGIEVFLIHPGGPFWAKKDLGAWSIPKGEPAAGEELLNAACRELQEETGFSVSGPFAALQPCRQKGGKLVHAWAVAADCDPAEIQCNTFRLEWPPRSGRYIDVPEIDRAEWFGLAEARRKINPAQAAFLDELQGLLGKS